MRENILSMFYKLLVWFSLCWRCKQQNLYLFFFFFCFTTVILWFIIIFLNILTPPMMWILCPLLPSTNFHCPPSFPFRLSWRCAPEETVPRPDGQLQPARETCPKWLSTHRGGTRSHTTTNHWRSKCAFALLYV